MINLISNWDWKILYVFYNPTVQNICLSSTVSVLAVYLIYFFPLFFLYLWLWKKEKILALQSFLAGLFSWLILCNLVGLFYFRSRPFVADQNVQELLFHRPDRSFPSDHAAFTLAAALVILWLGDKRWGWALLVLTILIALARVAAGLHYPSDILVGWLLGLVTALIFRYFNHFIEGKICQPIVKLAERLKL